MLWGYYSNKYVCVGVALCFHLWALMMLREGTKSGRRSRTRGKERTEANSKRNRLRGRNIVERSVRKTLKLFSLVSQSVSLVRSGCL